MIGCQNLTPVYHPIAPTATSVNALPPLPDMAKVMKNELWVVCRIFHVVSHPINWRLTKKIVSIEWAA